MWEYLGWEAAGHIGERAIDNTWHAWGLASLPGEVAPFMEEKKNNN